MVAVRQMELHPDQPPKKQCVAHALSTGSSAQGPGSRYSLPPWEPAMPMRRCEMKQVLGIYSNPDRRWSADCLLLPRSGADMCFMFRAISTLWRTDMIHAAVTQQIHGKAVGTTASWSNQASNNWGFHQIGQKTRSETSAMRGTRIHDAHG